MSFLDWFRPSRRLKHLAVKAIELATSRFYEGPRPPPRLVERIKIFQLYKPQATADDWRDFALQFAANCYREGFIRGYDWQERGWEGPAIEPERLREAMDHDWTLAESNPDWRRLLDRGYDPRSVLGSLPPDQRRALVETFQGAAAGGVPIIIDLSAYEADDEQDEA